MYVIYFLEAVSISAALINPASTVSEIIRDTTDTSFILSLQKPLEWPLVPSLERSVGIKPLAEDIPVGRLRHTPQNAKNGVIIRANSLRKCDTMSNKLSGSNNGHPNKL